MVEAGCRLPYNRDGTDHDDCTNQHEQRLIERAFPRGLHHSMHVTHLRELMMTLGGGTAALQRRSHAFLAHRNARKRNGGDAMISAPALCASL